MPDNVGYTQGSGTTIATDDVGGVQYQRIKPSFGVDGSAVDVSATNPFPTTESPNKTWVAGFAQVGTGLLATDKFEQRALANGAGVTQGSGNLLITTGTTENAEFLMRSTRTFRASMIVRVQTLLSQRIANQAFRVMLADKFIDGASITINSSTSITVDLTTAGAPVVTDQMIGQGLWIGAINGAAGVPGRYTIASVAVGGTSMDLTVSGWPASGSCTADLFGYNYFMTTYTGTTATAVDIDAQRQGWNGLVSPITISTTASPGHIVQMHTDTRTIHWSDMLAASSATPTVTSRGSRIINIPEDDVELYMYVWAFNSAAAASTTTWTIGFASVEDVVNTGSFLLGIRPNGSANTLPVSGSVALSAAINRIGFTAGHGIWYDDSSTALGASATFTGTSRDATATATATVFASASTMGSEVRALAEADVAGTLWIEASRDNTTWRRVKEQATATLAGGNHVAELYYRPAWRYWRVGYTNGATAQARLTLGTMAMAAT